METSRGVLAAAAYLRHLLHRFETWPLALADSHAGETAIQRAMHDYQTRDVWRLPLPGNTARLVAMDFAIMVIGREHGFTLSAIAPANPPLVEVPGGLPLYVLSDMLATPMETLQALNQNWSVRSPRPGRSTGCVFQASAIVPEYSKLRERQPLATRHAVDGSSAREEAGDRHL